jgi:putative acyl-CoA dehydrogenase
MDNAEESANPLRRLVTAVQKFWICKKAPGFAYECMESVGGNGYVHEWDFPRIFQQSPLNSIWEGSGNTIVLDILRTLAKEPESARSLYAELSKVQGQSQRYDAALASVFDQLQSLQKQDPNDVQLHGRFAVDALAQQLEAYVLRRYAPPEVADWYEMNHLEVSTGCKRNYGSLPVGFPTDSLHRIIDRNVNALLNK